MMKYLMGVLALSLIMCGCGEQGDGQIKPLSGSAAQEAVSSSDIDAIDVIKLLTIDDKGARPGVWTTDVSAAKTLAKEKQLAVIELFIGSDWSYASSCFAKNVLCSTEWQKFVDGKFVMILLDFPRADHRMTDETRSRNEQIRADLGVKDYPTMVFCGSDGNVMCNLRANAVVTTAEMIHRIRLQVRELPWEQEKLIRNTGDASLIAAYQKVNDLYAERAKALEDFKNKMKALDNELREKSAYLSERILAWEVAQKSPEDQKLYKENLAKYRKAVDELNALRSKDLKMTVKTSEAIESLQQEIDRSQRVLEEILLR